MASQEKYIVSARKYRPSNFRSVVGQTNLATTLKKAIENKKLAQAYLFCGPRGVGKTSCARIFAKTINCLNPDSDGEACGKCESCLSIDRGNSFDLVELDAASNNSVDNIRSITEQVNVPPQNGRYRVFIIDEVHMLSNSAFNAFLKTLEEPPANVVFILATTEKHKVIPTILSRCQIYDFKRIAVEDMADHLAYVAKEEGVEAQKEALGVIALKADGAMRDALSIFDQLAAATGGNITYEATLANLNVLDHDYYFKLTEAFKKGDVPETLLLYKEIRDKGFDSLFFINGLASHIRDLMVAYDERTRNLLETSDEIRKKYVDSARMFPVEWYYAALKILNDCDLNYRVSANKRLLIELALIRLAQLLKKDKNPFDIPDDTLPPVAPVKPLDAAKQNEKTSIAQTERKTEEENPKPIVSSENRNIKEEEKRVEKKTETQSYSSKILNSRPGANVPKSFRLTETSEGGQGQKNRLEKRAEPFTKESFLEAWNEFINTNPALHILVNAMRAAHPEPAEDFTYRILVDHPAQIQAFELSMPKLLDFLRDKVSNDFLALRVEQNPDRPEEKQLPPRELLKKIVENNPELGKFLDSIDAELE